MAKIIVVDDDPAISKIMQSILAKEGHEVFTFINGFEVLQNVQDISPALIISDISMPKLDGLSLCEALRNNENSKDIPVILLTASKDVNDFAKGVNLGVKFYCQKPLVVSEVLQKVKDVLK